MNAQRWLVAGALALAACSSDAEPTAPTVELSTTTVTTLPPTTETTEAPTTTEDPRIAEVEAAVAAFHEAQLLVLLDPAEAVDQIRDYATGDVLVSVTENTLKARAEGSYFEGAVSLDPVSTEIESADTALHMSCTLDEIARIDSEGNTVIPADESPSIWSYVMSLEGGVWRVAEISIGAPCAA